MRVHKKRELAGEFSGSQSEERAISALAIRIEYQHPLETFSSRGIGDDFEFSAIRTGVRYERYYVERGSSIDPVQPGMSAQALKRQSGLLPMPHWRTDFSTNHLSLDPYSIRSGFERVVDETSALNFLNNAGVFWPFGSVRLSQLIAWRNYFKWLRLPPETAMEHPEGRKAWQTSSGFKDVFFAKVIPPSNATDCFGEEEVRETKLQDRRILQGLRRFAFNPERLHGAAPNGQVISLEWHRLGDKAFTPRVPTKQWNGHDHRPFILIEASNAAEAIAATIYADRVSGVCYEICKRCGSLFEVKSGHRQQFCPPRSDQVKSDCSNAFHAKLGRDRARAAKLQRTQAL